MKTLKDKVYIGAIDGLRGVAILMVIYQLSALTYRFIEFPQERSLAKLFRLDAVEGDAKLEGPHAN